MITTVEGRNIIAKAVKTVDMDELGDDTEFTDAGIDSLDQASILLEVQDQYGVEIPDEDVDKCTTISRLVEVTNKHLGE